MRVDGLICGRVCLGPRSGPKHKATGETVKTVEPVEMPNYIPKAGVAADSHLGSAFAWFTPQESPIKLPGVIDQVVEIRSERQ